MSQPCRFLIMAAGTGGHVFPALAVAQMLKTRGHHVEWLGTPLGMEQELVAQHDIRLHAIAMKGFRGKSFLYKLLIPFLLVKSLMQVVAVLINVKPNIVVGFGGYIAVPGGIAAKLLCKKLIIHEQNSVAGSANKLLNKFCDKSLVAYPNALPESQYVGNPVRHSICALHKSDQYAAKPTKNILVMGGSLGAEAINQVVPSVFMALRERTDINVWHQTGKGKLNATQSLYGDYASVFRVEEFVNDVEAAYEWADIIICRAGALTVSELTVVGLPAVFIPLPHAIDNHQYFNAKWLADQQAATVIEQKALTKDHLIQTLTELLNNRDQLLTISKKLKTIAMVDATEKVVSICEKYCSGVQAHAA